MGLFGPRQQMQISDSIMPPAATAALLQGRSTQINTDSIFLKRGEYCLYIDKAILNDHVKKKFYQHIGGSAPGLLKGHRIHYGGSKPKEYEEVEQHKGILYITNKRTIFQSSGKSFDKQHRYLSSIDPYTNAVVLQYGDKNFEMIVPDGNVVNAALRMAN